MFIKMKIFKGLIKRAYTGAGLIVGHLGEGILLADNHWVIWLEKECIPKKALAAIIELTGEIPEQGQVFRSTSAGNQIAIPENETWNINKHWEDTKVKYTVSNIQYRASEQTTYRMLQEQNTREVKMINNIFVDGIDENEIDREIETRPKGPRAIDANSQVVYWKNEVCTLAAGLIMPKEEEQTSFLKLLENVELIPQKE